MKLPPLTPLKQGPEKDHPLWALVDPRCDPEVLRRYASRYPREVAKNPNTPIGVLEDLIEHHSLWQVVSFALANPAIEFLKLEDPQRYERISYIGQDNICRKRFYLALHNPEGHKQRQVGLLLFKRVASYLAPYDRKRALREILRQVEAYFAQKKTEEVFTLNTDAMWPEQLPFRIPELHLWRHDDEDRQFNPTGYDQKHRRIKAAREVRQALNRLVRREVGWMEIRRLAEHCRYAVGWAQSEDLSDRGRQPAELAEYKEQVKIAENFVAYTPETPQSLPATAEQISLL